MTELEDYRIGSPDGPDLLPPPDRNPGGPGPLLLAAGGVLVLGLLGAAGYLIFRRPATPTPQSTPPASVAAAPATPSPTPPIVLPALDESDSIVRDLAKALSSNPQLGVWLAATNLVRTFTVVVDNMAEGSSPAKHLGFLAPKAKFTVLGTPSRPLLDPASYARYDAFAEGFAALDAQECARVYGLLEPLFDAAYRELGYPEGKLRLRVAQAVKALLEVPELEGDVALRPVPKATLLYAFVDTRLEALTPPQKHLLRMGPKNVARIKAKLQELAHALEPGAASQG